ncbi:MAG: GNAT family N-acetyltransferase [Eubacteriales bacterium]|nr:GNAT family N-acetyltransferase [Eubacteriales bacterium]
MGSIWIKLTEALNRTNYDLIKMLEKTCIEQDQVSLKLELDYKLDLHESSKDKQQSIIGIRQINEFMCFEGDLLIGYIGISSFGGSNAEMEVNGMVHPDYRRRGVFRTLYNLLLCEFEKRNTPKMLLLSDRQSEGGQEFIKSSGASYKHSEYEMFLDYDTYSKVVCKDSKIKLRKATNADVEEIEKQNAIYFKDVFSKNEAAAESPEDSDDTGISLFMPEEEEKRGITIFMAEFEGKIIGKVTLRLVGRLGGIFGLGILPDYRGKGYGRELLMLAIEMFEKMKVSEVMLQVEANNENALSLYKSVGFMARSTMDYYIIS